MADFDIEQLKTLFENLGDRLERTKGDQLTNTELSKIRNIMSAINKQMSNDAKSGKEPDSKKYIDDFWRRWKSEDPFKNVKTNEDKSGQTIIKQLKDAKTGLNDYSREQNRLGGSFIGNLKGMNDALAQGQRDLKGVFKELKSGGIGGTAGTMLGAVLGKMTDVAMSRADSYREILASGEGTVSSMQDLGRRAAQAGLTVDQFTKAMSNGTQGARALGAIKFADVRKSVVEMSKASGYMGMLPDQITEVTSTYAEILRLQGQSHSLNTSQMADGIMSIVKSSETTAHILGITREDALKAQAELAKDQQLNAVMRAKGIDQNTARSLVTMAEATYGQSGKDRLLDQLTFGQVGPASAQFAAIDPTASGALGRIGDLVNSGAKGSELLSQSAAELKKAGREQFNDKGRTEQFAQLARLNASGMGSVFTDSLGGSALSQDLKSDGTFTRPSDQNQNDEQRAGVGVLQLNQVAQEFAAAKDAMMTAVINPMVDKFGPTLRDVVNPALTDFARGLNETAISLSGQTGLMSTVGAIGVGVAGVLATLATATAAFKTLGAVKGIAGILGGGGPAALGRNAPRGPMDIIRSQRGGLGAAAGAAEGSGGTILKGLMSGGKNVLGKAGSMAKGLGGIRGNALLGSLFEGYDYLAGNKDLSFKNLAKSGLRVAGGTLGGLAGGLAGGGVASAVTGVAGGMAGYKAGDMLGNAIFGADDITKPASARNPKIPTPQGPTTQRSAPANASPSQRGKNTLTMDQMTNRIMDSAQQSAGYLKSIKDQTDKQTDLMREEIAAIRTMSDRLGRLLEDNNKNTKAIADHTA
jgi:hypothetical protein